jgi:RNA polymerase primary sigma factor
MDDCKPKRSEPGALERYMGELSQHRTMTATEERAAARQISRLRRTYWGALLSHPPYVEPIAELVQAVVAAEECPRAELLRAARAARALRGRGTRAHLDEYGRAIAELASALAACDPDNLTADRIRADVLALEAGTPTSTNMRVRRPPTGSQRFGAYVHRVRVAAAAYELAKNRFVRANLRLVVKMARRYDNGFLPLADLIQEGNVGLMKAVDRFDAERGFKFSTYATWWIRHNITRAIANTGRTVRVPAHVSTTHMNISRIRRLLERELGRPATTEELADATKLTPEKIEHTWRAVLEQPVSTDAPLPGDSERSLQDILADDAAEIRWASVEAHAEGDRLREAIDLLPAMEADILRKRFGLDGTEEQTLAEIGRDHSLSRERIRQLQNRAIQRLREVLADGG